jgi:hypothetical protein
MQAPSCPGRSALHTTEVFTTAAKAMREQMLHNSMMKGEN